MALIQIKKKPAITYSISKAGWHTDRIKRLQEGKPIAPTMIQVDLEAWCNDSCEFCAYRKEDGYNSIMLEMLQLSEDEKHGTFKPLGKPSEKSRLPEEAAILIPHQMKEAGIPAIEITGGGEPTLWPWFDTFFKNLIENNIEIGLVTNGSKLSDERIKMIASYPNTKWIRMSMDSSNAKLHKLIHRTAGYDFERRLDNLRKLARAKHDDLELGVSFIVTPNNKDDIENAAHLYQTVGVSHIRFSFMYDKTGNAGLKEEQIDNLLERLAAIQEKYQTEDYAIYFEKDRINSYSQPNDDFDKCYMQEFVWAIGADSNVYPCCIMKYHPDFALGNLREKTLPKMVNDLEVIAKKNNLNVGKCFPCWLRSRNKSIQNFVEEPRHANFV